MAENVSVAENNARFVNYPYDLRRDWWNDLQKRKLAALAGRIHVAETVLDVGCNSGYFADFVPRACTVHGVDLSPQLVEIARSRLSSAQVAPAESLPFPDKSMDVVTIAGVLEYVYDDRAVMKELARVARRAIIGEANHEAGIWGASRVEQHSYMVRGYTLGTLKALLSAVGRISWVDIVRSADETPQHYVWEVSL